MERLFPKVCNSQTGRRALPLKKQPLGFDEWVQLLWALFGVRGTLVAWGRAVQPWGDVECEQGMRWPEDI